MSANLFLITPSLSHLISMIFLHDVVPLLIRIDPFAKSRLFSRTSMMALLALPFSGGAFTFTLRVSSSQPAIQSFDDEGMTLI